MKSKFNFKASAYQSERLAVVYLVLFLLSFLELVLVVLITHTAYIRSSNAHQVVGSYCLVAKSCPTLGDAVDCSPPGSLSMGLPRQEYRSGLLFSSPEVLPNPGNKPLSLVLTSGFFTTEPPGKPIKWWLETMI